jgi:hypothetical protein
MASRYVLRWHERTSWRRCGTELGAIDLGTELDAIDLGAELDCVHKARLAQSVERKALTLWLLWV